MMMRSRGFFFWDDAWEVGWGGGGGGVGGGSAGGVVWCGGGVVVVWWWCGVMGGVGWLLLFEGLCVRGRMVMRY